MRSITTELQAHLGQQVTTVCTCWKATLRDGSVLGFTDHTRDLLVDNQKFKSASGYIPTAIEASSLLNVDNLEVEAILNSIDITEQDLLAGRWDNAAIQIFAVNWEAPSAGKLILKTGTLGQVSVKNTSFVAEIRGLTQAYTTIVGELYSPLCRASLGDARCKVNMAAYTSTGTIQSIDAANRTFTDSSLTQPGPVGGVAITGVSKAERAVVTTAAPHGFLDGENIAITGVVGVVQVGSTDDKGIFQPGGGQSINGYTYGIRVIDATSFSIPLDTRAGSTDSTQGPAYNLVYSPYQSGGTATPQGNNGYFDYGLVTFTSGLNKGYSMEVKTYLPGQVELQLPMPYPVKAGDTYTIQAGCGKRFIEDCKTRFNNVINFRGEPHLPGIDQAMAVGTPAQSSN